MVLTLFGGSLLLAGVGLLFFLLPPLGHKPLPSLGHYFGPTLGISGYVFPILLDLERPDVAFHVWRRLFLLPSPSFLDPILYCPERNTLGETSIVLANQSPRPQQPPRP